MTSQTQVPDTFPFYRLSGTHREIGRQFGAACAELIHRHQARAVERLQRVQGVPLEAALAAALRFRPYVLEHAPFLDEEVQGVAEGAGLSLAEAYLLQLRAELGTPSIVRAPVAVEAEAGDECTSYAVLAEATSDGSPLVGQNADLPAFYSEIGVVLEIVPDDQPRVLMLTPAGQVSYIGMNDQGLGIFANFVTCDGWRLGFPRYFLSRLGLSQESVDGAIAAVRAVPRASSRNLMLLDRHGAADLETTPTRDARLEPEDGLLAHSNHYVAASLQGEERSKDPGLSNSRVRLGRMRELLAERRGELDAGVMQEVLRDRACYPDTICRMPGDGASDVITFASVIAAPSAGEMWVAVGPPNEHAYQHHHFSA
ncbi:MAG TPA: C45 family peptidase [Thermomicrobiaceae bacterium]|nr:C45 family peptidase [Thermomicrobiaceae bacterium]